MSKKIYTVSRLNQEVQQLLESGFGTVWLRGELSNFSRPASGHFYFSLKDSQAQLRCAMFKGRNRHIGFRPENGDAVLVRGKLGLYTARGDFQLIVEHMEPAGAGELQAAFEATKKALNARGWFDQDHKLAIPAQPQTIGVITSPTGAALRDVLHVLERRYRQARIIIYPTLTQGASAAPSIAQALDVANARDEADVLLLVRGGGSLEDLWAFNEVAVAEAMHRSELPIVTGIGHEVDVTIADLVADLRAPTPSAAAELATPDNQGLQQQLASTHQRLQRAQRQRLDSLRSHLTMQISRLQARHPERRLQEQSQRVDDIDQRLQRAWENDNERRLARLQRTRSLLQQHSPRHRLASLQAHLQALHTRLENQIHTHQTEAKAHLEQLARALHGVSPLAVLSRGYALVLKQGQVISDASTIIPGDTVTTRLSNGEFEATVTRSNIEKP